MTLNVKRSEFAKALRSLGKVSREIESGDAMFTFADGHLGIELSGNATRVPAQGDWPGEVRLPGRLLSRLARSLPEEDPLPLRIENGRLFVSRFSVRCDVRAPSGSTPVGELIPPDADPFEILMVKSRCSEEEIDAAGATALIAEAEWKVDATCKAAARVLQVYGVTPELLRALCDEHAKDGTRKFRDCDGKTINQVADAWRWLAPFGIEPEEIKNLMDRCLRNAWKEPR